jgi:hypothetical protein
MNIELREHRLAITSFLSATAILVFALMLRMTGAQLSWDRQDDAQPATHFPFFQDCSNRRYNSECCGRDSTTWAQLS